jgi:hypothetical protein
MRYETVYSHKWLPIFRRILLPPSSDFYSEDEETESSET